MSDDLLDALNLAKSLAAIDFTESDTRAQLIDPILERLGWGRGSVKREPYAGWGDAKGYVDYVLLQGGRATYVVEAKRVGRSFEIPSALRRQRFTSYRKLRSTASPDLIEALDQCLKYSQHTGALYACATTGTDWVFFKPTHPHRSLPDARVCLFSGVDDILTALDVFEALLAYPSVEEGNCEAQLLGREIQVPSFAKKLRDAYPYHRDQTVEESDYSHILDQMLRHYLLELTSDVDFDKGYVAVRGNRNAFNSIDAVVTQQAGASKKDATSSSREFAESFISQQSLPNVISGRTVILHGAVGVGKTSFLRQCELELRKANKLRTAVWARINLLTFLDRPFDANNVGTMLRHLCTQIQNSVSEATQEMSGRYDPDTWDHLRDIYNSELRRFQKGRFPNSDDSDSVYLEAARRYVWEELKEKDPQEHLVRVVRWLTVHCQLPVVVVLDNSDQLGIEFQEFLYKLADTLQRQTCAVTLLVMRTEALESHRIREHSIASVAEKFQIQKAPLPKVLLSRFELMTASFAVMDDDRSPQNQVAQDRITVLTETLNIEADEGSDTFRIIDAAGNGSLRDSLRAVAAIFRSSPKLMDRLVDMQARGANPRINADRALRAMIKDDLTNFEATKLVPNVFVVEGQVTVPYSLGIRMIQQVKSKSMLGEYTVAALLNEFSIAGIDRSIAERVLHRLRLERFLSVPHMLRDVREGDVIGVTRLGEVMLDVILNLHDYYDAMAWETVFYDREVYEQCRAIWIPRTDASAKLMEIGKAFARLVQTDDESMRRRMSLTNLEPVIDKGIPGLATVILRT